MRIHHLNAISACPLGGALMDGRSVGQLRARLVCHCLLVESPAGLVLVDTGYGLRDVAAPRKRLSRLMLALMKPELRAEMTAYRQIQHLGLDPRDVRHIVLTHLDFDHAGGLDDFPWASVHLLHKERAAAARRRTPLDRMRYRPQQWGTQSQWVTYDPGEGEPWLGFDCVRQLEGLPPELLLVPLFGHTLGHAGVAVRNGEGWILQAGDAYFFHQEVRPDRPYCTPGLRAYQWMMQKDGRARRWNQGRLRQLAAERPDVTICCGHDPTEFERLAHRPFDQPLGVFAPMGEMPGAPPPQLA